MRRIGGLLLLASCAPVIAELVKRPGEGGREAFAAVNDFETGKVAFRAVGPGEAAFLDGRPRGQELMFLACDGPYRVESEDSDTARMGSWRVARFTCVNGPPMTNEERTAQRLAAATGCAREYIFPESTDGGATTFIVCQARYVCGRGDRGVDCTLAQ
jgi:hypothetical protein